MWLAETSFACLSDYRGDKKKTAWNFKFEVYRAADQAKAGQMEEGAFAEAQVPYAKFGLRKVRYLAGSLALRNQLRRGAMQSSKGRMIKNPPKPGIACMQTPAYKQINGPLITKKLFPTSTS